MKDTGQGKSFSVGVDVDRVEVVVVVFFSEVLVSFTGVSNSVKEMAADSGDVIIY